MTPVHGKLYIRKHVPDQKLICRGEWLIRIGDGKKQYIFTDHPHSSTAAQYIIHEDYVNEFMEEADTP